jgi:hypothetical protein
MHTLFAIAGSVVNFAACVSYVRAILRGEAAPNRVTWFLWALVPVIAGAAQWRSGVGISTLVVLSVGLGPACIVLASFVAATGSWKLGPFDYVCGACSLAALALWAVSGDPVTAIVLSILADAAAALPTLRKAWLAPATEDRSAYLIAFAGMVLGILSVQEATFSAYAFNAYLVLVSLALVLILYLPRRRSLAGPVSAE